MKIEKMDNDVYISKLICVIVLYKSPLESSKAFISLTNAAQLANIKPEIDLIVYDNSPEPVFNSENKIDNWNIIYVHDQTNPGLSKASNEAFILAKNFNKEWVLFSNPDTEYAKDYFIKLFRALKENPGIDLFVPVLISNGDIVSPSKYLLMRGSISKKIKLGLNDFKRKSLLYSGMFISSNSFEKVGTFKNEIKLDYMDTHFFDKFKREFSSFFLIDCYCNHDLSSYETDKEKVKFRHVFFCEGARNAVENFKEYLLIGFSCFAYSLKLSLVFKDISFLRIFSKYFFSKNTPIKI